MGKSLKAVKIKKVTIELGEKERTLCYDLNAFSAMEEKFDTIENALQALQDGKIKALRFILWAGLTSEDSVLTETEVGKEVGLANLEYVIQKVNEAISDSLPPTELASKVTDPNAK